MIISAAVLKVDEFQQLGEANNIGQSVSAISAAIL
jgi:hypothetical protein